MITISHPNHLGIWTFGLLATALELTQRAGHLPNSEASFRSSLQGEVNLLFLHEDSQFPILFIPWIQDLERLQIILE